MQIRSSSRSYPVTLLIACVLVVVYIGQHHLLPTYYDPPGTVAWHYVYAADTTLPFDVVSYVTAAATHLSAVHLLKNLTLLGVAGILVERRISPRVFLASFVITAIVGTGVFAVSGHLTGVERLGAGASGGTYAMVALATLVISTITVVVHSRTITLPLWAAPACLVIIELVRAITTPVISSPYPKYAHIAGVCVAVCIWVLVGRPCQPLTVTLNAED